MKNKTCDNCGKDFDRSQVIACNIFRYTENGTEHIATKFYCCPCADIKFHVKEPLKGN